MLWLLILFLLGLFVALHTLPFQPERVAALKSKHGEGAYKAVYAVLSVIGLVVPFFLAPHVASAPIYDFGDAARWLAIPLTLLGFILMASPAKKGAIQLARHPMLAGFALWGLAHLLTNGDLVYVVIFGTVTAYAMVAIKLTDDRDKLKDPQAFAARAAVSHPVPLVAIAMGQASFKDIRKVALIAGTGVWLVFFLLHPWLFGVTALPYAVL